MQTPLPRASPQLVWGAFCGRAAIFPLVPASDAGDGEGRASRSHGPRDRSSAGASQGPLEAFQRLLEISQTQRSKICEHRSALFTKTCRPAKGPSARKPKTTPTGPTNFLAYPRHPPGPSDHRSFPTRNHPQLDRRHRHKEIQTFHHAHPPRPAGAPEGGGTAPQRGQPSLRSSHSALAERQRAEEGRGRKRAHPAAQPCPTPPVPNPYLSAPTPAALPETHRRERRRPRR